MTDEELLAAAPSLPVLYYDGFGAYRKLNGVLRCVGWTVDGAQANVIISLPGAEQANRATRHALDEKSSTLVNVWHGVRLAH
jgi:hypothetical protein